MKTIIRLKNVFFLTLSKLPMPSRKVRPWFVKMGGVRMLDYKSVFIGDNVQFDTIHPENIIIGKNVLITTGCVILTHFFIPKMRTFEYGNVLIEDNVFMGCNSVVCKSVVIGKNAVIAAGSIITNNIPENQVWGGNPARLIKQL